MIVHRGQTRIHSRHGNGTRPATQATAKTSGLAGRGKGSDGRFVFTLARMRTVCLITARVQPEQKNADIRRVARPALAGLLMASWLFVTTLAVSPALHQYFHHGAADAGHSCAVTLLAQGKFLAASAPPALAVFVSLLLFCVPLTRVEEFSSFDLRLGFGRAPPRFFRIH